jgi:copper chaperone CopZ
MTVATTTVPLCPSSGTKGKQVSRETLYALVRDEFQGQIADDADYYFCDAKGCDVVYFTTDGRGIRKPQLKVEVGVKETAGERPLCYCFGHSIATIKGELLAKGRSDALEDIRQKMEGPGCACEVTNPSGACCLGMVGRVIDIAKAELNGTTPGRNRAETISKVGTVLSAVMASACCWLPLVLLAFGVSGVAIAGALEPYRPLFIVLTLVFLAGAFYFTYRPRKSSTSEGDCRSTAHECCTVPKRETKWRPFRMTINKVMLWAVALAAVAFLLFPQYMGLLLTGRNRAVEPNHPLVRTTAFTVEGMACEGCSALVEEVIQDVPGVVSVKVDYDKKLATAATEESRPVPTDAIINALRKAGYRATLGEPALLIATGTTDSKEGCCEKGCCEKPSRADKGTTDTRPVDPGRQIIFTVIGFT